MGDVSDWARTQREDTSAAFPPRPLITDPTPEEQAVERFDAPLPGDDDAEAMALDIKMRDWDQRIADMGANIGAMISDAPGRIARGAEGLYGVADQAAEAALNYPPKVFADPIGEARKAGVAAGRAQEGLVNLGKTAATGDPAAIRDAADLASMTPGTGPIPDLVSGLASYAKAFDSENPGEDVLWGTLSLATLPLWWLSSDALRKAAKSGIKQSAAAQSLQVNIQNLDLNMTNQLKKVDADLSKGTLTPEKADLYRTQIETEGKRLVVVAETRYTAQRARDYERVNRPMKKFPSQQGPSLFNTLMPPGALDTFRAYPDTQATKQARSVAEGINRRLNARKITPDQAREELRQMNAYAEHAERQAGDVVGQTQDSALRATESRGRGKISEDRRVDPTDARRVVEEEANKATSVAQGPVWENDKISGTGPNKVVRKIRPGARNNVERLRTEHRVAKREARKDLAERRNAWNKLPPASRGPEPVMADIGPEPTLGPDDYHRKGTTPEPYQEGAGSQRMAPESTKFEPLHEKTIREREEWLRARNKAEAKAYDPIEAELLRLGRRPGDKAAKSADYQAERRAMRRDGQWNDAELAVIEANPGGGNPQLVEERLRKLRQEGKRVVQKEDGSFVISSERSLLGGEDMPEVDSDFLKAGNEADARMGRQLGPVGSARTVKLSPEELSTLRLNQPRQAKPLISGSATRADRIRDLNTQIRDIEAKLDADKILEKQFPGRYGGTLQRELRYDLAQALDGRERLLREGDMQPLRGSFAAIDDLEAAADRLLAPGSLTEDPAAAAVRRKVEALLQLAGSDNEYEAKAALEAAHRLMRKHSIAAAAKSSRGGRRAGVAPERQVKPPPPTDPRAINRTRRERLAEASEARADVAKPETVDSLPRRVRDPDYVAEPKAAKARRVEEFNVADEPRRVYRAEESSGLNPDYRAKPKAVEPPGDGNPKAAMERETFFDQAKRDSYPDMSEREVLENVDEMKQLFRGDPEMMAEITRIEREAKLKVFDELGFDLSTPRGRAGRAEMDEADRIIASDETSRADVAKAAKERKAANADRQTLDELFEYSQGPEDLFPTMSRRDLAEKLNKLKRTFKDDPEAMRKIARIEDDAVERAIEADKDAYFDSYYGE